jgi:L-2-hydroxyglutarate oxidase LhgO
LEPAFTGIRPKLGPPGSPADDFVIQSEQKAGAPQLIQLFGIESPGLTASLAIAERVRELLCSSAA